jgi:hypothetical protein
VQAVAGGASSQGSEAVPYLARPKNHVTPPPTPAAVVGITTDPTTRGSREPSIASCVLQWPASPATEELIAAGAESGGPVTRLLATLHARIAQRGPSTQAIGAGDPPRKLVTARPASPPNPGSPIPHPPPDTSAGSAAGPGGVAPAALWFAVPAAFAAWPPRELRGFRIRLLVPGAAGVPSLRDRPG